MSRAAAGAAPGVVVRSEPYNGPIAQLLVAALIVDIEERYAADGEADDPDAEWALGVDEVTPPRGVFLVALPPRPARRLWRPTTPSRRRCRRRRDQAHVHLAVGEAPGRGRAVLARLESEAVALGYRRVQLETGLRQPEAMALYEASGYHRVPTYGIYATSDPSACFAKDIARD